MEQGLASEALASNAATVRTVASRIPVAGRPHTPPPAAPEMAVKGAVAARNVTKDGALDPRQQTIQNLQSVKSAAWMPFNLEFFGGIAVFLSTWVTEKLSLSRVTTVIKAALKAPVEALRETEVAQILRLPANWMKSVAGLAADTKGAKAGDKTASWAASAERRAASMTESAMHREARVVQATGAVRSSVGNVVDSVGESAAGQAVHGWLNRWTSARAVSAEARHTKAIGKATAAATQEGVGFFARIMNRVTGKIPATVEAGALGGIADKIAAAKGNHAALKTVASELDTLMKSGELKGEVAKRASQISSHLGKAVSSAGSMEMFSGATGGNLKSMLGAVLKSAGKVKLFSALIGVGVVAGVGATVLTAKAESAAAKDAMKDMTADLGGQTNSSFMQAVKAAHHSNGMWGKAKAGLQTAGEVANGALFILPGGGGAGLMAGAILPELLAGMVPDNQALNAYTVLKQHDAGTVQLEPEQRIQFTKQLIALMPSVASHGGIYNHLVTPVAEAMHNQKMTAAQVVQLLGDESKFTAFAKEVAEKQAAAKIEKPVVAANDAHMHAPQAEKPASAEARYHAAEKPALAKVSTIQHAGTVAANHDHIRAQA